MDNKNFLKELEEYLNSMSDKELKAELEEADEDIKSFIKEDCNELDRT